jgi:hypothetical protein
VCFKKSKTRVVEPVCEKRDAEEGFFAGVIDGVSEEFIAEAAVTIFSMDDDILEENDESSFCSTDRKKKVYHA